MSRAKARKAQRKENERRKHIILIAGLLVIVGGIFAVISAQSQSTPGRAIVADGNRPAWQNADLISSKTGETFKLADFDDKHVVVKIMSPY